MITNLEQAQDFVQWFAVKRAKERNSRVVVDSQPFSELGTNSWVFKGNFEDKRAVFKVARWANAQTEAERLQFFERSGLVPRLFLLEAPHLLIEEFVDATPWSDLIRVGQGSDRILLDSVADAVVSMAEFGLQYVGLSEDHFRENLAQTLDSCDQVLRWHSDVYSDRVFARTLRIVVDRATRLIDEPMMLYQDDCGPDNTLIANGQFARFVDLADCWPGTVHLHAGALMEPLTRVTDRFDAAAAFQVMRKKLSARFLLDPLLIEAAAYLKVWIPLVRHHGWNGWITWPELHVLQETKEQEHARAAYFALRLLRTERLCRRTL
jgi:hypothetical protein